MDRTFPAQEINQTRVLKMYSEMGPVKKEKLSAETADNKQLHLSTPSLNENYATKFFKDEINQTLISKMQQEMVPVKQEKSSAETVDDKHFQSLTPSLNEISQRSPISTKKQEDVVPKKEATTNNESLKKVLPRKQQSLKEVVANKNVEL